MLTTRVFALALLSAALGCTTPDGATKPGEVSVQPSPVDPPGPPPRATLSEPGKTRRHMRWRLADLRAVERYLLAGDLEDAKARAYMLSLPESDPGVKPWARQTAHVVELAQQLANPPTADDALRTLGKVAQACGECHLATQTRLDIEPAPELVGDDGSTLAVVRMARHQWAADRIAEGIVLADDGRWRAGLAVLAADPLPYPKLTDAPASAAAMQRLAKDARTPRRDETFDDRAHAYGEILVQCAACHAALRPPRTSVNADRTAGMH